MELIFILTPFIVLFGLILLAKKPILVASFFAALAMIFVSRWWGVEYLTQGAAFSKAALVTFDIGLILIGAILFLETMRASQALEKIKHSLLGVSTDLRVQSIIIGVFFVGLVEGLSGFGTPAMLAAPLLASIGLSLPSAVLVALIGNAVIVPFGAAGTPLLIGLNEGAATLASFNSSVFTSTVEKILILSLPALILIPTIISALVSHDQSGNWKKGFEIWRFNLLAGFVYALSVVGVALLLGPEFPALLGAMIAGIIIILAAKYTSILPPTKKIRAQNRVEHRLPTLTTSLLPTFLVITLLLVSRVEIWPIINQILAQLTLNLDFKIGDAILSHRTSLASSPGFYLILGALLGRALSESSRVSFRLISSITLRKISRPVLSLLFLISITQLLLFSSINTFGLPSMPVFLANSATNLPLPWIVLAPVVGLLGALVTGSVTVSNLLFAGFQGQAAALTDSPLDLVLTAQILGASAGNMIALHNLIAVATTLGAKNQEGEYLKLMIKPALIYMATVSFLALLWASWLS